MKNRWSNSAKVAAALTVMMATMAADVSAAIVCNNTAIAVPRNGDGVYINWTTGATGTSGTAVPGFDVNFYGSGLLNVFWGADGDPNNAGVASSAAATGTISNVAAGTAIGPTSIFNGGSGVAFMAVWQAGVADGILGFSFTNDTTNAINFGWARMSTTATSGHPASISRWCIENTGAAIVAGTTPVALQSYSVD